MLHSISPLYLYASGLLGYVIITFALYRIARSLGHDMAWLAFIPIANVWLLQNLGEQPTWLFLIFFVPFLNILYLIVLTLAWERIARKFGKSGLLAIGMWIPVLNLFILYDLAFSQPVVQSQM